MDWSKVHRKLAGRFRLLERRNEDGDCVIHCFGSLGQTGVNNDDVRYICGFYSLPYREDWRRSLSTTCSALYESGCWICAIAKWCLWAAALFCCAGRSRIPARWERLCSSRTSTPMQLDLNTCTGLKQWAGDNHDGQKRKGALLPAVQYR